MTLPGFLVPPPPSALIGQALPLFYRQGVIKAWNPLTLGSTVTIDGVDFTDLPVLGLAEFATFNAGDVVGLMCTAETMAIIGQIVTPGTSQATEALGFLGAFVKAAEVSDVDNITSTSWQDLTHAGPTVTANIGPSGKALVLLTADLNFNQDAGAAYMGVDVSGATTITPDPGHALVIGKSGTLVAANMILETRATAAVYFDPAISYGLNPGVNTFKAKYMRASNAGIASAQAGSRSVTVLPL